jgi:phage shock protein A
MGIFTRFKDIVSSNINSMLDHAEDPQKMVRLMIREMEETLVELKANCAGLMATRKKIGRELDEVEDRVALWAERAERAVAKGREDLAVEALNEKKEYSRLAEVKRGEMAEIDEMVEAARDDIEKLEEKLQTAVDKQRVLVERHHRAHQCRRARRNVRQADSMDAVRRFEQMEQRIERMEAEADLTGMSGQRTLEDEFSRLEMDEDIQKELDELKQRAGKASSGKKAAKTGSEKGA